MKKIEAIVRPERFEEVKQALNDLGNWRNSPCATCAAASWGAAQADLPLPAVYASMCCRRSRSKWWWERAWQTSVIQAVIEAAHTGESDDGQVFVSEVIGGHPDL